MNAAVSFCSTSVSRLLTFPLSFQEFMMATDMTASGSPEEKLRQEQINKIEIRIFLCHATRFALRDNEKKLSARKNSEEIIYFLHCFEKR
jgi:hypothetical protein